MFGIGKKRTHTPILERWNASDIDPVRQPVSFALTAFAKSRMMDLDDWVKKLSVPVDTTPFKSTEDKVVAAIEVFAGNCFSRILTHHDTSFFDPDHMDVIGPAVALSMVVVMSEHLLSVAENEKTIEATRVAEHLSLAMAATTKDYLRLHEESHCKKIYKMGWQLADGLLTSEQKSAKDLVENLRTMAIAYVANAARETSAQQPESEFEKVFAGLFDSLKKVVETRPATPVD